MIIFIEENNSLCATPLDLLKTAGTLVSGTLPILTKSKEDLLLVSFFGNLQ